MAPLESPRKSSEVRRGRPPRTSLPKPRANGFSDGAPPPKKRRYIPGGPGGGGRYVDVDGSETPVGGGASGAYPYTGPRSRPRRESAANGVSPIRYPRPRRENTTTGPLYSSAAAAAAAVVQGDGFKPREERGWEEFHPDLDIAADFTVFSAEEVDGIEPNPEKSEGHELDEAIIGGENGLVEDLIGTGASTRSPGTVEASDNGSVEYGAASETPIQKRRPGRPPRRQSSMLNGLITPQEPKYIPPPGPNPRERLTLPKPSFRKADPFSMYEQKGTGQVAYVDRAMASVGYQESDIFIRPENRLIRITEGSVEEDLDLGPGFSNETESNTALGSVGVGRVEYDMDEQDDKWLDAYNGHRRIEEVEPIKREIFEVTMTKIEKEWHALEKRIPKPNPKPPQTHRPRSSSAAAVSGEPPGAGEEQDSKCAICDDGDCENTNAIVFCDGCDLAVHQECYGVPFIPEGQWLCRKCQLIGRGTPTCIFCPNIDGAFKQTNTSRWSHLLCAIWIPEVSLGNMTFMEPVLDVEKVPKQRWKLTCYICRQKMGACIQCGNKNCFVAFHVTCARRARLFLKMKSAHGGPANLDASVLKAYCDKHVPSDWRRENDTDRAILEAQDFYHHAMRGRIWADSQRSALALAPPQRTSEYDQIDDGILQPNSVNNNKRKRNQPQKPVWKLPSGAPVIPQALYNSVESSLQRFTIRKRKEYAAEACKYWTLKRESRRGAALLKRLQLQMETFSSMEITRRDFAAMGAIGRVRLQRRIDFAEQLLQDVDKLRLLTDELKKREREKLKDVEILRGIVDTVYFPINQLLWPILQKAETLDGKGVFRDGLAQLRSKLDGRYYTSVAVFSADVGKVFSSAIGLADSITTGTEHGVNADLPPLDSSQKEKRKLAKRIIRAIQGMLENAGKKEAELGGKPYEKELKDLDSLLNIGLHSRRGSLAESITDELIDEMNIEKLSDPEVVEPLTNGHAPSVASSEADPKDIRSIKGKEDQILDPTSAKNHNTDGEIGHDAQTNSSDEASIAQSRPVLMNDDGGVHETPPTPPMSSEGDLLAPFSQGGIPWYMEPFDPVGTTIHEERWTGRDVVRGMSEELSEIDEEELRGLVDSGMEDDDESNINVVSNGTEIVSAGSKVKRTKFKRKSRAYR